MEKKIIRREIADKTRATIIKAAHKLFAEFGFSDTTTQAIAKAAKVNETLIFHHFGTKAKLWQKVKAEVVESIQLEPLNLQPSSLLLFIKAIIQQRLSAFQQRPDLVRLIQWQRLETKTDKLADGNIIAPKNWLQPIQHLQQTGKIKAAIPPEIIMIWLTVSIDAVIFEKHSFLHNPANSNRYLEFITAGLEKVLSRYK